MRRAFLALATRGAAFGLLVLAAGTASAEELSYTVSSSFAESQGGAACFTAPEDYLRCSSDNVWFWYFSVPQFDPRYGELVGARVEANAIVDIDADFVSSEERGIPPSPEPVAPSVNGLLALECLVAPCSAHWHFEPTWEYEGPSYPFLGRSQFIGVGSAQLELTYRVRAIYGYHLWLDGGNLHGVANGDELTVTYTYTPPPPPGPNPPLASFTPLGDLPGGVFSSSASAVSADGAVVVGSSGGGAGREAFRWDADGGMQGLGDLPGGSFQSQARGVSADGTIVVGSSRSAPGIEAFRWDAGSGLQGLGDLPGGDFRSRAVGVSADGQVIAGWGRTSVGVEALRWDATSGLQGIGDLPGSVVRSSASAISADGSTIVGSSASEQGEEAFRWDAVGGMQGLGDLPGGSFASFATGVSGDGSIVVGGAREEQGEVGFVWDSLQGMQPLPAAPDGGIFRQAFGISPDGRRVVGRGDRHFSENGRALVWDDFNGTRSLEALLQLLGVSVTGWQLTSATAISADGRAIVGEGINPVGDTEAFLALLPASFEDWDADGVQNPDDACPAAADPDQADADGDGVGDVCNDLVDADGDEWADAIDNCPLVANADQVDIDHDSIGDRCDFPMSRWTEEGPGCADPPNGKLFRHVPGHGGRGKSDHCRRRR